MDILPNIFDMYYVKNDGSQYVDNKFLDEGTASNFFSNTGPTIMMLGLLIILWLISYPIKAHCNVKFL